MTVDIGDLGNALVETIGGLLIWLSVRRTMLDKQVKGVSVWPITFFTCWGIYNLWLYPHANLWLSGYAAIMPAIANVTWLAMIVKYKRNPQPAAIPELQAAGGN